MGDELRIVSGDPTPEELAVVIALAAAAGSAAAATEAAPARGRWNDPARVHRGAHAPGPGGWRTASR